MPITQLPVPENPLPQEREAYFLVEIHSEMNSEHVELEGVNPILLRTLCNFHIMFTTFLERLCHAPIHSTVCEKHTFFSKKVTFKLKVYQNWRLTRLTNLGE